MNCRVLLNLCKSSSIDGLRWFCLLDSANNTVIKMLIEFLSTSEDEGTCGTLSSGIIGVSRQLLVVVDAASGLLAAVWWCLLDTMHGSQVPLEDIGTIERLFSRRSRARAESTDHRPLVVGQSVSVFVIFAREALDMIITCLNGTLFRPLILVSDLVSFHVLKFLEAL